MRKLLLTATIPLLTMLILIACNQGTFVSEGNLRFTGVTVNKSRATIGDEIEILWDYENANRLAAQRVKTVRLLFQGLCSPDFCPEPIGELESSVRSATFVFEGPTTVVLEADDDAGRSTNVVFDIRLDEEFRMQAEVLPTNSQYPRLGIPTGANSRIIDFAQFLGIYEMPEEDSLIDWLANNPSVAAFLPPDKAFRARSPDEFENNRFGFEQGSRFPFLDPDFRTTPDGQQFTEHTFADVILFGGAMAYDGAVTTVKSDDGELAARENVTSNFEAIFITVDMRTDDNGDLHLADIHIGNLNQGLVLSVFDGITTPVIASTLGDQVSLSYSGIANFGDVGITEGIIKGSVLSDDKTSAGGELLLLSVGVNLEWMAPFFPDTDLGGRAQIS